MLEILIGALGGIFIGATGVGAGSIITPLLILIGYPPAHAVSAGFFVLIAAKAIGSAMHWKLGHWPGRGATAVVIGGAVGVLAMSMLLVRYVMARGDFDVVVKHALGATLIVASLIGLVAAMRGQQLGPRRDGGMLLTTLAGVIVGALVCLTSAGSGALLLLLLIPITSWSVAELAGVSNIFGLITGLLSLLVYTRVTELDWRLFILVGVGILPGVLAGVWLSRKLQRRWFLIVFNTLAISLGVALLIRA